MAITPSIRIRVQTRPKVRIRVTPALIPANATIEIGDVTTLPPGSDATVVDVGTPGHAIFDIGLPRGDPGAVASIVAGTNITVNSTDPAHPIVSAPVGAPIVILSTGQSNTALHPTYAWTPAPNLYLWNFDGIVNLANVIGTAFALMDAASMGFDYSYANETAKANPMAKVYLVKIGIGAQAIAQWKVGASPATLDMYAACKNNIQAALLLLGVAKIDQFLWWQGESDALASSATYLADFETVIARFRAETWFPAATPVTIMGFSPYYGGLVTPFNATLAVAAAVEADARKFIYAASLPIALFDAPSSYLHATAAGYEQIGKLAYQAGRANNQQIVTNPVTGNVGIGGLPEATLSLRKDQAGQTLLLAKNVSASASASVAIRTQSDKGTMDLFANSAAAGGLAGLAWTGAGPLLIQTVTASQPIWFYNGATPLATLDTTGMTVGKVIGGTGVGSSLSLQSTSGVGSADFINFKVGNNGALDAGRFDTAGRFIVGATASQVTILTGQPTLQVHTSGGNVFTSTFYTWTAAPGGPLFSFAKSRGAAVGTRAIVQSGDTMGFIIAGGDDGTIFVPGANIQFAVDGTPGANDMPGRIGFSTTPDGAAASVERLRIDNAGVLSHRANAQVIIDANSHHQYRTYTVATLPSAATAGQQIWCSDLGGGGGALESDGTVWKRLTHGGQETNATNADFTLTTLTNAEDVKQTGTLTANRAITLSTTAAYKGARFRVTRTGSGAFNLTVAGKALIQNTWAEAGYDGSAWYLAAYGAL